MAKRDLDSINIPPLKARRRELRNNPTPAEAILWKHLQRRQMLGKKFLRQYSIGRYIVDFYCPESRLIVELDGAPHSQPRVAEYDARRTEYLHAQGFKVIRFENRMVYQDIDYVLDMIRNSLNENGRHT